MGEAGLPVVSVGASMGTFELSPHGVRGPGLYITCQSVSHLKEGQEGCDLEGDSPHRDSGWHPPPPSSLRTESSFLKGNLGARQYPPHPVTCNFCKETSGHCCFLRAYCVPGPVLHSLRTLSQRLYEVGIITPIFRMRKQRRKKGQLSGECQDFTPHPPAGQFPASHSLLACPVTGCRFAACPETASSQGHAPASLPRPAALRRGPGEREAGAGVRP